jgi:hypothetical protein
MCQFYKRLDRRAFKVPDAPSEGARYVEVDDAILEAWLDGNDVEQREPRRRGTRPRMH